MGEMSVEPSMEEILSSIKRIIAEEGDGPARGRRPVRPAPAPRDEDAEVLELSDPVPDFSADEREHDVPEPVPAPVPVEQPAPAVAEPSPLAAPEPVAAPIAQPAPTPSPAPIVPEPIVSASTAQASRGSLDSLSRLVVKSDHSGDGTLEGLVRDMLRPMLRDWLDAKLPAMVEAMVADEIARITGQQR